MLTIRPATRATLLALFAALPAVRGQYVPPADVSVSAANAQNAPYIDALGIRLDTGRSLGLSSGNSTYTFGNNAAQPLILNGGRIWRDNTSGNITGINNVVTLQSDSIIDGGGSTNGGRFELNGVVSGAGGFTKQGSGIVALTNAGNTFSGPVVVDQGILAVTASGQLGQTSAITVNTGGQLRLDSGVAFSFGAPDAVITLLGAGDGNGALRASNTVVSATRSLANTVHLAGDATIGVQGANNTLRLDGDLTGAGVLTVSGANSLTLTLAGANASTVGLDLQNGTTVLTGEAARTFASLAGVDGTTLNYGATDLTIHLADGVSTTYQGQLAGTGDFIKDGAGALALTQGAKTHEGRTIIREGVLRVSGPATPSQTSELRIESGGTLLFSSTGTRDYQFGVGDIVLEGGTIYQQAAGEAADIATIFNDVQVLQNSFLEVEGAGFLFLDGALSGAGDLTKLGTGTVVIRGDFSGFTGSTVIQAGELFFSATLNDAAGYAYNVADGASLPVWDTLTGAGGLRFSGDGDLVILNPNTFTGDVLLLGDGRVSLSTNDAALGSGNTIRAIGAEPSLRADGNSTVSVAQNIVVETDRINLGATGGSTLVLDGVVSGPGSVRFASGGSGGGGVVVLNNQSTYAGHTTINTGAGGIVRLGVDNALPTGTELRFGRPGQNTGTLDLNGFDQLIGNLRQTSDLGVNTVAGITGTGDSTFTVVQTDDYDTFIPFSGGFAFVKQGPATLGLLADSPAYTGAIELASGGLRLGGVWSGASVNVASGATLSGAFSLGSLVNAGTVSPGNSPGVINVLGDFTQTASGVLLIELAGAGDVAGVDFDQLAVTGTAFLDGALRAVAIDGYLPQAGDTFTGVVTAGLIDGQFASIQTSPFLTLDAPDYAGNQLTLTVQGVNFAAPTGLVLTPNQAALAAALDAEYALAPAPGSAVSDVLSAVLGAGTTGETSALLDGLIPTQTASLPRLAARDALDHGVRLQGRLADAREAARGITYQGRSEAYSPLSAPRSPGGFSVFSQATGRRDDPGASDYGFNSAGVLAGFDYRAGESIVIGAHAGFDRAQAAYANNAGRLRQNAATLGLHATVFNETGLSADFGLSYTDYSNDLDRVTPLGLNTGSPSADRVSFLAGIGQTFRSGRLVFQPRAALIYSHYSRGGFTETGSASALTFSSQTEDSLQTTLGARLGYTMEFSSMVVVPELRASWQREWADNSPSVAASFGGSVFSTSANPAERDTYRVGVGATAFVSDNTAVFGGFDAEFASGGGDIARAANIGVRWFMPTYAYEPKGEIVFADQQADEAWFVRGADGFRSFLDAFHLSGRVHLQWDGIETKSAGVADAAPRNSLFARRVYLGTDIPLTSTLTLSGTASLDEHSDEKIGLFNASLDWKPLPEFGLSVGYDKVPYLWEETTSSRHIKTVERSAATRYFGDFGNNTSNAEVAAQHWRATASGEVKGFYYAGSVALPSKQTHVLFDGNRGTPSLYARLGYEFDSRLGRINVGGDKVWVRDDFRNTPGEGMTGHALHATYKKNGFSLLATAMESRFRTTSGGVTFKPVGYTLQPAWQFHPKWELVTQISSVEGDGSYLLDTPSVVREAPTRQPSRRFDDVFSYYVGFNHYIRGNDLKLTFGYERATVDDAQTPVAPAGLTKETVNAVRVRLQWLF